MSERIFVGVLRLGLRIPGARSRKDRRQVVGSLVDRLRHRFEVSVHQIDRGDQPTMAVLAITTAGNDGRRIRSILDRCADFAQTAGSAVILGIDVDVFRWHPRGIESQWTEIDDG